MRSCSCIEGTRCLNGQLYMLHGRSLVELLQADARDSNSHHVVGMNIPETLPCHGEQAFYKAVLHATDGD